MVDNVMGTWQATHDGFVAQFADGIQAQVSKITDWYLIEVGHDDTEVTDWAWTLDDATAAAEAAVAKMMEAERETH